MTLSNQQTTPCNGSTRVMQTALQRYFCRPSHHHNKKVALLLKFRHGPIIHAHQDKNWHRSLSLVKKLNQGIPVSISSTHFTPVSQRQVEAVQFSDLTSYTWAASLEQTPASSQQSLLNSLKLSICMLATILRMSIASTLQFQTDLGALHLLLNLPILQEASIAGLALPSFLETADHT